MRRSPPPHGSPRVSAVPRPTGGSAGTDCHGGRRPPALLTAPPGDGPPVPPVAGYSRRPGRIGARARGRPPGRRRRSKSHLWLLRPTRPWEPRRPDPSGDDDRYPRCAAPVAFPEQRVPGEARGARRRRGSRRSSRSVVASPTGRSEPVWCGSPLQAAPARARGAPRACSAPRRGFHPRSRSGHPAGSCDSSRR